MKKAMSVMVSAGVIGAGIATYCLMNKDTKKNADKLLNTAMNKADKCLNDMDNC